MKQAQKQLKKNSSSQENLKKVRARKLLLVSLFPFVDESKLLFNMAAENAVQKLWEDECLDYKMNKLNVGEVGLITRQKEISFKKQLSNF